MRSWKKAVAGVALATVGAVGFMGFLHTSAGRPFLMAIGGCPVGKASAADVEQGRMQAVRATRGTTEAPARPALGFTLDTTSVEEVRAWASTQNIQCVEKREGAFIQCKSVPASALPGSAAFPRLSAGVTYDDVSFGFRPSDKRLVNVTSIRYKLRSDEAVSGFAAVSKSLEGQLGDPSSQAGEATLVALSSTYAVATLEYRYRDYMADLTATNVASSGLSLREHYISATE